MFPFFWSNISQRFVLLPCLACSILLIYPFFTSRISLYLFGIPILVYLSSSVCIPFCPCISIFCTLSFHLLPFLQLDLLFCVHLKISLICLSLCVLRFFTFFFFVSLFYSSYCVHFHYLIFSHPSLYFVLMCKLFCNLIYLPFCTPFHIYLFTHFFI